MTRWIRASAGRELRAPAGGLTRSRLLAVVILATVACQVAPVLPPPAASGSPSPSVAASAAPGRHPLGGTLRVGLPGEPGLLDPGGGGDAAAEPVLRQIYESLVDRVGDRIVGRLATKWSVAADARTWTFTLREGVLFHDGTPLDAAAAARSLTRNIERAGGAGEGVIESATASGPAALTVVTRTPLGPFLALLATPRYAIVRVGTPTVGSGPFLLRAGSETARPLTVERNPAYWRSDPGGTALPYLDRIVFQPYPDPAARTAALRAGAVDLLTELPIADVPTVRGDPSLQLLARPPLGVLSLGLNLGQPPLDDPKVRQAIAAAVNRPALVDRLYAGEARAATQLPPPGILGHDDSILEFSKNDPDAAKKLLAQAGKAAFEIDLWYLLDRSPGQPDARRIAESIAADLAAVGITANLKTIDLVTFVLGVRDNRYPLWLDTTTLIAGDPDELLGRLFIPPVVGDKDQPTAGGAWTDRESAGLLRKARSEPDESKRAELYKQVSKIVQQQIPRIPLVWSTAPAAATKKVIDPLAFWSGAAALGK